MTFAGVGWYLDWFQVFNAPGPAGHRVFSVDLDAAKIQADVQKGEAKVADVIEKARKDAAARMAAAGEVEPVVNSISARENRSSAPAGRRSSVAYPFRLSSKRMRRRIVARPRGGRIRTIMLRPLALPSLAMARCEQGYLCRSAASKWPKSPIRILYLRYVLGEVPPEQLHLLPECHVRCNPSTAQYIVDPAFPPVVCDGAFAKTLLDAAYVAEEEARVTRGWRRLQELPTLGVPIIDYPLPTARTDSESEPAPHRD